MRRGGYILLALVLLLSLQAKAQIENVPQLRQRTPIDLSSTSNNNTGSRSNIASPFGNDTSRRDSTAVEGLVFNSEVPDSVLRSRVFSFFYNPTRVWIDQVWSPLLDPTGAQFNDPLDALNGNYYLSKGVVGHQHVSLFPTLANGLALQMQPNGYEGYYMTPTNIRLYQTLTPYTVLSYNSSLNKDYGVRVSHTQNIMPGWNIALNYRLFSPEGIYTSSGAVNNYFNATTNYFSPDSRLQAVAGIIWHKFRISENGGLAYDSIFTERTQTNRAGIPVNLNGTTQQRDLAAFGKLTYSLERQSDTYRHRDSVAVRHINDSISITDTLDIVDTIPLHKPHILNLGVVGLEVNYDRRKRVFTDSTLWRENSLSLYWTNDAYADHRWRNPLKLTLGITPRLVTAVIEGDTLRLSSLFDPFARAEVALFRGSLTVEGNLQSSFGYEPSPDSRLAATFYYPLDSARRSFLSLSAVTQRQAPDVRLLHDAMLTQDRQLNTLAVERYRFQLNLRDILDIDLRTNHLNHNTWYDIDNGIVEGSNPLWLTQAAVTLRLKAGPMHLDVQQLLQHSTDSVQMPVPLWASKNSFYADFRLFRRLLRVQIGVDVRYHTPYFAPHYDPATGLFLHQRDVLIGGYLWGDAFLNLQVKRASIYVKGGHINALWEDKPEYFLLPHYPGQRFGLFWGITWHFFD